jgi:hypothetical protein
VIDPELAEAQTRRWLAEFVVGLNLCPFARPLLDSEQLRIAVIREAELAALQNTFLAELDLIQARPEADIATSMLVFTGALADFDNYLNFLALAQELLEEVGLEGLVQLASFHPDYRFEGEADDSPSHYSNRSPYPTIHLIREDMVERVLVDFPDPEGIPGRNIATLQELGVEELRRRWKEL